MNDIRDLLPGRMRERTFSSKPGGTPVWRGMSRSLWNASSAAAVPPARSGPRASSSAPTAAITSIGAYYRLSLVLDSGSFRELDAELAPQDVLGFPLHRQLSAQTQKTGLSEAAVAAVGRIGGVSVVAAVLDSRFFMGSMSTAVGEKITRAIEYAAAKNCPLVIFSASGGARMQEAFSA